MQSWRRCQRDFHRQKIFDNLSALALVVALILEKIFVLRKISVERVPAMRLVDYYQIVSRHRRFWKVFAAENPPVHALNRRNLHARFPPEVYVFDSADVVNSVERQKIFQLDFAENVQCLFAQRCAVDQKQNAPETFALQKSVNHCEHGTGFAGPRRHCQQNIFLPANHHSFSCRHGSQLIFAQIQAVVSGKEIRWHRAEIFVTAGNIPVQQFKNFSRAEPIVQRLRRVGSVAQVEKPDAGFSFKLLLKLPSVRSENKWHAITVPIALQIFFIGGADIFGVVSTLAVKDSWNIFVAGFRLDKPDEFGADKKRVISEAGFSFPFGDGEVATIFGVDALETAQIFSVSFPTSFPQLFVDNFSGFKFKVHGSFVKILRHEI